MKPKKVKVVFEQFSKTESGKSWKSKPDSRMEYEWDYNSYEKYVEAASFFRRIGGKEHLTRAYTPYGYIPTRVRSIRPDRKLLKVAKFTFS